MSRTRIVIIRDTDGGCACSSAPMCRRGLAVTPHIGPSGREISVTHIWSGHAAVDGFRSVADAERVLLRLARAGDWNRPEAEVIADERLKFTALSERARLRARQ